MSAINVECALNGLKSGKPILFVHRAGEDSSKNYQLHVQNYVEIYIYMSGEVDYVVEDGYYSLRRGDIVVITPRETHMPVLRADCFYERFYILVPTDSFSEFFYDPLTDILDRRAKRSPLLVLPEEKREELLSDLYRISSMCYRDMSESDFFAAYMTLAKFISAVGAAFGDSARAVPSERQVQLPPLVKEILTYINNHLTAVSSIGELADTFHLSLPYMSSLFRKHIGVPVSTYLRTRRIGYAKQLLEEGKSVTFTCYECGFNDCSHFIRVFRECVGVTPLRYRNVALKAKRIR